MKLVNVLIFLVILLTLVLTGCQAQATQGNIVDDLGRTVQIKTIPQRIISLSPSNTEIVYALGLEDKLVGLTTYCNYPPQVTDKPRVSDFSTVDIEKIVSMKPDLILADDIQKTEIIPNLEKLGLIVVTLSPDTMAGILKDIKLVGDICGKTQAADALVADMQSRMQQVTDKTSALKAEEKPRAFFLTWYDPLWTAGSETLIDELMTSAGGVNIASDLKGHSQISLESLIERNPQIIFVMTSMGSMDKSLQYIKNEPRLKAVDAVKNNQVYPIDPDVFGRTTPRSIDGLETMAKLMHPDLFK